MFPSVSIILPLYNAQDFVSRTIQSVLEQSYQRWELLIVDDGSTDTSAKIIEPFLADSRIKYFFKKNTGVSDTRNFGAKHSKGQYLCFLDADDLFYPENLFKKANYLLENPAVHFVFADVCLINENDKPTGEYFIRREGLSLDDLLLWDKFNIPGPSSIMVAKDAFEDIGKWDVKLSTAADQDFFFRVALKYKLGYINEVLTAYRVLSNSMSRNVRLMEADHIAVYNKAAQANLFKTYWFKKRCFANLYLILAGSWWVNGKSKFRGLYFMIKAFFTYPPSALKLFKKQGIK